MTTADHRPREIHWQHDSAALSEIRDMVAGLVESVARLESKVDALETEFAPLARKYGRILGGAAAGLPGAGWRRNGRT